MGQSRSETRNQSPCASFAGLWFLVSDRDAAVEMVEVLDKRLRWDNDDHLEEPTATTPDLPAETQPPSELPSVVSQEPNGQTTFLQDQEKEKSEGG